MDQKKVTTEIVKKSDQPSLNEILNRCCNEEKITQQTERK